MNIINCSPFNNCGAKPDCGCGCGCGCGCSCGCGCRGGYELATTGTANYSVNYSCYKNNCAAGYGCGCAYPWACSGGFIPTPEEPFPCIAACAAQGRQVDYSGYTGGFCHVASESPRCLSGAQAVYGYGCQSGCASAAAATCEEAAALLQNPCYGLASLKAEVDQVRNLTGAVYEMMAPVPVPCSCTCTCA